MDKLLDTLRVLNQLVMLEQKNLEGMPLVLLVQLDRLARTLKHVRSYLKNLILCE